MRYYYSADAIRAAEAPLLASLPDGVLMGRAAYGLATAIAAELKLRTGGVAGRRICAVVGSGDNGGDALWAATFLRRRGVAADARVARSGPCPRQGPGRIPPRWWPRGIRDRGRNRSGDRWRCRDLRPRCVAHQRRGRVFEANTVGPVVAVDIPSGLDVQTGAADGPHVRAALTVTFGGLKPVHALGECGRVELIDIGLDLAPGDLAGFEVADVRARWPIPGPTDDKYTQGVTGVLSGSSTYPGAAVLSTGAAVAATSGMVRYAGSAAPQVLSTLARGDCLAYPAGGGPGPGLGGGAGAGYRRDREGRSGFALESDLPVIVDADGLTMLAADPGPLTGRGAPTVLTPHAGEFHRLAGHPPGADRVAATRELAAATRRHRAAQRQCHRHRRAGPAPRRTSIRAGQSWAATAGSGDVLSGIIGALLAAGLPAGEAAARQPSSTPAPPTCRRPIRARARRPPRRHASSPTSAPPSPRCNQFAATKRTSHVAQAPSRPAHLTGLHRPVGDGAGPVAASARRVHGSRRRPTGSSTTSSCSTAAPG